MRVPRVFIAGAAPGACLPAGPEAFHHLVRVLRRGPGDELVVLDGAGGAFEARIEALDAARDELLVRVGKALEPVAPAAAPLTVALAMPRGDGFETALRWASEMGLEGLIAVHTARSVRRPPASRRPLEKLERWRRISLESAEQCRRNVPLAVEGPLSLGELFLRPRGAESRWIALPGAADPASAGLIAAVRRPLPAKGEAPGRALVLIGPEGGFEDEEVEGALAAGFVPVGFPTPVLRTPTTVAYLGALASMATLLLEEKS